MSTSQTIWQSYWQLRVTLEIAVAYKSTFEQNVFFRAAEPPPVLLALKQEGRSFEISSVFAQGLPPSVAIAEGTLNCFRLFYAISLMQIRWYSILNCDGIMRHARTIIKNTRKLTQRCAWFTCKDCIDWTVQIFENIDYSGESAETVETLDLKNYQVLTFKWLIVTT